MNSLVRRISDSTFDHFNLLPSNKQPRRGPRTDWSQISPAMHSVSSILILRRLAPFSASVEQIFAQPYFPSFNQKNFLISSSYVPKRKDWQEQHFTRDASRRFVQITSKLYYFKIAFTFCLTKNSKRQARSSLQIFFSVGAVGGWRRAANLLI